MSEWIIRVRDNDRRNIKLSQAEFIDLGLLSKESAHTAAALLLLLSRLSRVRLCATPLTAAHQAPPSMGFSRQECWSGVPLLQLRELEKALIVCFIGCLKHGPKGCSQLV